MNTTSPPWHRLQAGYLLWLLALGLSTGATCINGTSDNVDGNVGLDPVDFPGQRIAGEPNNSFDNPLEIILSGGGGHLQGTISSPNDVDVYALNSVSAGDRIILDVATPGSLLDPMLAVFDEGGRFLLENDDRNPDLGQYDPFLNHVVRHDNQTVFVALATSSLANGSATTGSYEVLVTYVPGGEVPEPSAQTVLLDFDGGTVQIPDEPVHTVGVFDTADISPSYAGMTAAVRDQIAATVRENYEGLALNVLVTPGNDVPTGCTYSTVLFGGRSFDAFGVAEAIDSYNSDRCDDAIIFTNVFTPARFGRVLTAEELGTAIGNLASHELGHLLGLNHVANVYDIMDTTGPPGIFLYDQEFLDSDLYESIFPIGTQDALMLLLDTLGAIP